MCAAVISAISIGTVASAQPAASAPQVKSGAWVRTSDGAPIGRIEYVDKAKDGTPQAVAVIYQMRIVHIPAGSLSAQDKGFVTSLTKADVNKLQ